MVAFASDDDFQEFAQPGVGAYYAYLGSVDRIVVTPGRLAFRGRELLAHELTHHFTSYILPRTSPWLGEGLACFVEPVGTFAIGAGVNVGTRPASRQLRMRRDRVPVAKIFAWDGSTRSDASRHYDTAWLLVHYLVDRHEEFWSYLQRLSRGENPDAAWRAVFPAFDLQTPGGPDALESALDDYVRAGGLRYRALDVKVETPPVQERILSPGQVHEIRLRLWPVRPGNGEAAALAAEIDETLGEAPGNPTALRARTGRRTEEALPAARLAVKSHPGDWRAWSFLATVQRSGDPAESLQAWRRAVELAPDGAQALHGLAAALLRGGQSGEALPLARRAARLAPFSAAVVDNSAAVAADLGLCEEALSTQRRALEILGERAAPMTRSEYTERLSNYEKQCAGEGTPATRVSPTP